MANKTIVPADWVAQRLAALDADADAANSVHGAWIELRARREADRSRGRTWLLATAGACLTVVSLITFPAPRALAQRCVDCSVALLQTLTPVRPATLLPEPREAAPEIGVRDTSGRPITLSSLRGRVILLNFWATWCHGCKAEMPWFVDFEARYAARGLTVVGVSMDDQGWKVVRPFVAEKHINYLIAMGDPGVAARYGATESLPVTVLIDRHGHVAGRHIGVPAQSEYEAEIRRLLSER